MIMMKSENQAEKLLREATHGRPGLCERTLLAPYEEV